MAFANLSRRGFLGNLAGAATTAVVVPAVCLTLAERRKKAQDELIAIMKEQYPGKGVGLVDQFDDLFMIKIHV